MNHNQPVNNFDQNHQINPPQITHPRITQIPPPQITQTFRYLDDSVVTIVLCLIVVFMIIGV